jgi:gliding motility-associated-like protein
VTKPIAKIPDVVVEICDLNSYTLNPQNGLIPDVDTVVPTGTTYTWTDITNNSNIDNENQESEIDYPQGVGAPSTFNSGILHNINPLSNVVETAIFEVTPWTDGCPGPLFTISIAVSPEPKINAEITNIDCSFSEPLCAGSIEVNPVGIAPFTYNWTSSTPGIIIDNPSAKDQIDLCPGSYELSISDGSNCTYNYVYEIVPPTPIEFDAIVTDVSCNNINQLPCDGSIQVTTTGGTLPFDFVQWNRYNEDTLSYEPFGSSATYELIGICAGDYLLEIIDANGCQFNSPVYTIEEGVSPINITESFSDFNGYNIDCYGANNGSISIDISGGSGVFDYEFFDGTTTITGSIDTQQDDDPLVFSFLFGGEDFNYTFTLLDSNCPLEIVREYTLTEPEELIISAELVNPAVCFGDVATYLVTASGGLPPYTGDGLIEVQGGPITFTVTDTNDCQDEFSTVVPEPEQVLSTFNVEDALCFEGLGTVTITPIGGTPLLIVNIYDILGNPAIVDSQSPSQNTSSGLPVNFNLPNGNYYYEVLDSNQCKYGPEFFSINEPDPINIIDVEVLNPDCNTNPAWEFNNGSICITLIGGTDPFPIGSGWINNGSGQWCLENLSEGIYSIDATDINDCSLENIIPDITLTTPPEITVSFNDTLTIDCDTNTATQTNFIFIDGGVPPYEITWSGGNPVPPNAMEATESGNYSAFVNDQYGISNGCPPIEFPLDPIVLSEFGVPDFSFNSLNSDFCGIFSVGEPINFQNTSTGDIVNFTWNFGDGSPSVSGDNNPSHIFDSIGSYTVDLTVEDVYGCFDTYSETIDITKGYGIILPTAFTPNGDGINETIRPVYNCMTDVSMRIYDTWGSLLYQESGETIYGWDGTINGNSAENGNYIIVVVAQTFNGKTLELNGPITLIK